MSREAFGDPPDPEPQRCPVCDGEWHAEGCELGAEVSRRLKAESEVARLRAAVQQLEAAEEGAKEAFGVVVQEKRDALAECQRLRLLLDDCHAQIRRQAALLASKA